MALLLRRNIMRAMRRGSTWSRSTDPAAPPAFLTSLDNPQTYFDSSELRAVGGLETQPQSLNAETEKVLHDEAWRGVAKKRGLLFESMVERDIATQGAFAPAAVLLLAALKLVTSTGGIVVSPRDPATTSYKGAGYGG